MSNNLRTQIYNHLTLQETEELLKIWQSGDTSEWVEDVFELVGQILLERLGYLPPRSSKQRVSEILESVKRLLERNQLDEALQECELAIRTDPSSATAYYSRGGIYAEMGQPEKAIADYQKALQLDPEFEDAWESLSSVEAEIARAFEKSAARRHLDRALEYVHLGEPERALEECEAAKSSMPNIAAAYNELGMILEALGQLDQAVDAYLLAVQFNPRFYAARENLANARVRLEEEQYRRVANLSPDEIQAISEMPLEFDEQQGLEVFDAENPIPGWLYLDEKAFLLSGWAGHRTRPGRSGYDPLDSDFELAHMQGVIIRRLITGKFRTLNPLYFLLILLMGLIYSMPLLSIYEFFQGNYYSISFMVVSSPYWIVGVAFLVNAALSLWPGESEEREDDGCAFF